MKIKLKTNAGFQYSGEIVEENSNYIILMDWKEGQVHIPISNISFLKKISEDDTNGS
jgi:hypothetical protein